MIILPKYLERIVSKNSLVGLNYQNAEMFFIKKYIEMLFIGNMHRTVFFFYYYKLFLLF